MTPEELIKRVRLLFIENDRTEVKDLAALMKQSLPERWRELLVAMRSVRARRRILFKSSALRNLAAGYSMAGQCNEGAVINIYRLITWLAVLGRLTSGSSSPQELLQHVESQQQLRATYVRQLREMSSRLNSDYADELMKLAGKIDADRFALHGTEVGLYKIGDPDNLGTRGGSKDPEGAWRGWFIRELRSRMPHLDKTPEKYATVAGLLTWAGVGGVTPMLARSILTRS